MRSRANATSHGRGVYVVSIFRHACSPRRCQLFRKANPQPSSASISRTFTPYRKLNVCPNPSRAIARPSSSHLSRVFPPERGRRRAGSHVREINLERGPGWHGPRALALIQIMIVMPSWPCDSSAVVIFRTQKVHTSQTELS
jgi:hypothetical protein